MGEGLFKKKVETTGNTDESSNKSYLFQFYLIQDRKKDLVVLTGWWETTARWNCFTANRESVLEKSRNFSHLRLIMKNGISLHTDNTSHKRGK